MRTAVIRMPSGKDVEWDGEDLVFADSADEERYRARMESALEDNPAPPLKYIPDELRRETDVLVQSVQGAVLVKLDALPEGKEGQIY